MNFRGPKSTITLLYVLHLRYASVSVQIHCPPPLQKKALNQYFTVQGTFNICQICNLFLTYDPQIKTITTTAIVSPLVLCIMHVTSYHPSSIILTEILLVRDSPKSSLHILFLFTIGLQQTHCSDYKLKRESKVAMSPLWKQNCKLMLSFFLTSN